MKCFAAIVIAAIMLTAEGSVIPLVLSGPIAIPAPAGLAIPGATVVQSNPAPAILLPAPVPAIALDASGVPTVVLAAAPAPAVIAVAPVPAATSISATRGAVHVAPLPGHAVSQQQLNLAPAPGSE